MTALIFEQLTGLAAGCCLGLSICMYMAVTGRTSWRPTRKLTTPYLSFTLLKVRRDARDYGNGFARSYRFRASCSSCVYRSILCLMLHLLAYIWRVRSLASCGPALKIPASSRRPDWIGCRNGIRSIPGSSNSLPLHRKRKAPRRSPHGLRSKASSQPADIQMRNYADISRRRMLVFPKRFILTMRCGPSSPRAGNTGAVLTDERIYAELIADGHHVHPAAIRLIGSC